MNHQEKVALLQEDLRARGVGKMTATPPLFQLAWRFGIMIPPPHFMTFGSLALLTGSMFAILWGAFMWLSIWRFQSLPTVIAFGAALAAGVFFGTALATYYRWKARRLSLPSWSDYGKKG